MVKCKECGGEVSSKADSCPKCGFRLKAKPAGFIVGFFRLIGGIVGAFIGLLVAISFLLGGEKRDPVHELESRCRAAADSFPIESERLDFYSSCVSSGRTQLKSIEPIAPTARVVSTEPSSPLSTNASPPVESSLNVEPPFNSARNPEAADPRGTLVKTPERKSLKCGLADATLTFQKNKETTFGAEAIVTVSRGEESVTYYSDEEFVGMDCRTNSSGKSFVVFQAYCGGIICKDLDSFGIVDTKDIRLLLEPSNENRSDAAKILGVTPQKVLEIHSMGAIGISLSKR